VAAVQREAEELFSSVSESIDSEKSLAGKKSFKRKRESLFGGGKESMDEFKTLLCKQIQYVVPKFERTTIVKVVDIPMHTFGGIFPMPITMAETERCQNTFKI